MGNSSVWVPRLSYSAKFQYDWCPRQYKYARVDRRVPERPKNASTITGTAIHRVVELMYKRKRFELSYIERIWPSVFARTFRREKFVFKRPEHRDKWFGRGRVTLAKIFDMASKRDMLVEPIAAEKKFRLQVESYTGRRFLLTGKIDLILRVRDEVWVIDLKTGTYKMPESELHSHDQLTIYSLAVRTVLGITESKLGFWYPTHDKILWTTRDEENFYKLIESVEKNQKEIEGGQFDPTYKRCHLCQYTRQCAADDDSQKTGLHVAWFGGRV